LAFPTLLTIVIDKLFTDEFWQTLGALIARHPSVIILLLFLLVLGAIIQRCQAHPFSYARPVLDNVTLVTGWSIR
jgi:hypothetical protein